MRPIQSLRSSERAQVGSQESHFAQPKRRSPEKLRDQIAAANTGLGTHHLGSSWRRTGGWGAFGTTPSSLNPLRRGFCVFVPRKILLRQHEPHRSPPEITPAIMRPSFTTYRCSARFRTIPAKSRQAHGSLFPTELYPHDHAIFHLPLPPQRASKSSGYSSRQPGGRSHLSCVPLK